MQASEERRYVQVSGESWDHVTQCNVVSPLLVLAAVFTGAVRPVEWLEQALWSKDVMVTIRVH